MDENLNARLLSISCYRISLCSSHGSCTLLPLKIQREKTESLGNDKRVSYTFQHWLPAVFDSFATLVASLWPGVLVSLQGAETNSSKNLGQREKGDDLLVGDGDISWHPSRGRSRASGRESGWALRKGLLSHNLRLSVSLKANLLFFSEGLLVMDPQLLGRADLAMLRRGLSIYQSTSPCGQGLQDLETGHFPLQPLR